MKKDETAEYLQKVIDYRSSLYSEMKKGRIDPTQFANMSYQYLQQHRMKSVPKAYDKISLIFNYLYWSISIERRIYVEREIIEGITKGLLSPNTSSKERLLSIIRYYKERRNRSIRRLIADAKLEIESATLIFDDVIELKFLDIPFNFYCSKEALDKLKITNICFGLSKDPIFASYINIDNALKYD